MKVAGKKCCCLVTKSGRRQWHPTPVLLPGKSYGQRSLVGCSPWGREESDRLSDFTFTLYFHALEKEMADHSSVLAWRIPGTGEPGGLPSMGSHRVGHDWKRLSSSSSSSHQVMSDSFVTPWKQLLQAPSVCRVSQARIVEWLTISFSRGSSQPGIEPRFPALAGVFFTTEPPGKQARREQ